jgi:hypothetical protein
LAPYIAQALQNITELSPLDQIPPVSAYPLLWKKNGEEVQQSTPDRRPGMTAYWQMQVGGKRNKK